MDSPQAVAKKLLKEYYKISSDRIPETREMSQWKQENKCVFLLGILDFGLESHITKLCTLLETQEFKDQ